MARRYSHGYAPMYMAREDSFHPGRAVQRRPHVFSAKILPQHTLLYRTCARTFPPCVDTHLSLRPSTRKPPKFVSLTDLAVACNLSSTQNTLRLLRASSSVCFSLFVFFFSKKARGSLSSLSGLAAAPSTLSLSHPFLVQNPRASYCACISRVGGCMCIHTCMYSPALVCMQLYAFFNASICPKRGIYTSLCTLTENSVSAGLDRLLSSLPGGGALWTCHASLCVYSTGDTSPV